MSRFPHVIRSLALLVLSLALIQTLAAPATAKPGGNSEAAKMCEENGYQNYQDGNGMLFRNAGQCTRYAAQGQSPQPRTLTVALTWEPGPGGCDAKVVVTGFPDGTYAGTFEAAGVENQDWPFNVVVSGGTGTATVVIPNSGIGYGSGVPFSLYAEWTAILNGVSSGPSTVDCST